MSLTEPSVGQSNGQSAIDGAPLLLRVFLGVQDSQWNAISLDYTIVGVGGSADEAKERMLDLVDEYLRIQARDGVSIDNARRPIPLTWRAELRVRALRGSVARLLGRTRAPSDSEVKVPLGGGF